MLPEQRVALRAIRRRRLFFWVELALGLMLLVVALRYTHSRLLMLAIVILNAATLARFAGRAAFSRCPRCGQYFHSTTSNPTVWNLLTRRCLHCGLALDADRVLYPSMK